MKITLATGNKHKVDEINLISKGMGIEFVLPCGEFNPIEDGDDFISNALCKAKCASLNGSTELYLADDSGLCIDFLNGEPGIKSARYAPSVQERIDKVLYNLKNAQNRNAHFTCAMVVLNNKGEVLFKTQQYCYGKILTQMKGEGGFGYDPIFFVDSEKCSMAQLTKEKKAEVSHRAKALKMVLNWLIDTYKK